MINSLISVGHIEKPTQNWPRHSHKCWEIVLYTNGNGTVIVGDKKIPFKPGTVVCQPPHINHEENSESVFTNYHVLTEQFMFSSGVANFHVSLDHPIFTIAKLLYDEHRITNNKENPLVALLFNTFMQYLYGLMPTTKRDSELENIRQAIIANFNNPDFNVSDALNKVSLSKDHARRLFTVRYKQTPVEYLINLRIIRAKELLFNNLSIKEVAYNVGIQDTSYFIRLFTNMEKTTPKQWKIMNVR
jgi:AraC-like DNA-binding protein